MSEVDRRQLADFAAREEERTRHFAEMMQSLQDIVKDVSATQQQLINELKAQERFRAALQEVSTKHTPEELTYMARLRRVSRKLRNAEVRLWPRNGMATLTGTQDGRRIDLPISKLEAQLRSREERLGI